MMPEFKPTLTFEFNNSKKIFENLLEEYSDFDKQPLKSRFAMNCAINSWHLTDWTFQEFFINDIRFQDKVSVDKKDNDNFVQGINLYQQYLTKLCPELEYMRLITNGTKHCILKDKNRKEKTITKVGDFCSSDFSRHDFNVTRFIIEIDKDKHIDFEKTLLKTMEFWKEFVIAPK
jgi:hypothetical protein